MSNFFFEISWNCLHTWKKSSVNTIWCLIGCSIGDFGTIGFFQYFNIDSSKIIFYQREKIRNDHLKLYNKIDVTLDTFPYPGVTTSMESIWMGVPVLTLEGNNFVSRCGESINLNLNMPEFIAKNKNDYINKAIAISDDKQKLVLIRKSLRKTALNSPLFDMSSFGQHFSN